MKNNMERLVKELQERFGEEYEVVSVKVPKNKEVLDGSNFPEMHWIWNHFLSGF